MATMSIEVLCVGAKKLTLLEAHGAGIDVSHPPKSDRDPALWQDRMTELGGLLIHIFDESRLGHHHRWAYDIVDESDWEMFRFKPLVWKDIKGILVTAIEASPMRHIEFYSDAQWSNEPVVHADIGLGSFIDMHDEVGINMNCAFPINSM